ncbi:Flagellin N-methylase [Novipirellula aureliae]|uniref:Flagellin N-methylase n=1 Tax=Novipirellula aureliae TaxID=2527966 RepID=A0A5C6E9M4_9BACT|nr:YkgJ family cysteine cluster protein [Novipirellula aureliae]TWU45682.1 Flagellin N-methylase [Novipirellula aureliae]
MAKKHSKAKKETDKWYQDGLRFECTQCGDCCSGAPGFVWVEEDEIDAMADSMDLDIDSFEYRFVRQVGRNKSLKEYPDGDCILLDPDTRKCSVYDARPTQCRTWPFWDSNLATKQEWKETCKVCPGSGTGKLISFEEIEIQRKKKSV